MAADVEDEILAARLPVGAHLGRRVEFMDRFGISPMIMSETLRILRSRGLVAVRPGTGGGIFVAALPPQVRLGGMDLWFHESGTHPLDLFEARVHLEAQLTPVAFDRATEDDVAAMRGPLERMGQARDARAYLDAVMGLHRALVSAARVPVLDAMHQSVVAVLQATLSRAGFVPGHEPLLQHSIGVHQGIVEAIASRNRAAFHKVMLLHNDDLVRADDPRRSPGQARALVARAWPTGSLRRHPCRCPHRGPIRSSRRSSMTSARSAGARHPAAPGAAGRALQRVPPARAAGAAAAAQPGAAPGVRPPGAGGGPARRGLTERSFSQSIEGDVEFHRSVVEAAGNPLLAESASVMWRNTKRVMGEVLLQGGAPAWVWDDHRAILAAIRERDADRAEALARRHAEHGEQLILDGMVKLTD